MAMLHFMNRLYTNCMYQCHRMLCGFGHENAVSSVQLYIMNSYKTSILQQFDHNNLCLSSIRKAMMSIVMSHIHQIHSMDHSKLR